jgi:hypothetical protein
MALFWLSEDAHRAIKSHLPKTSRAPGGWTTKVHALTDGIGRPYSLMPNSDNVGAIEAAPALFRLPLASVAAGALSVPTRTDTVVASSLNAFSRFRISDASLHATTSSQPTSSQASRSPLPCLPGSE